MTIETVALTVCPGMYFSDHDKDVLFEWLRMIPAVEGVRGEGRLLHLSVRVDLCDKRDWLELIAAFGRYDLRLNELSKLEREHNRAWVRRPSQWWYQYVFPGHPEA